MKWPQRHRVTEKKLALCLCASVAMFLRASTSPASAFEHPGKVDVRQFHSRVLNANRTVRVWQPAHMRRGVRYSVLYLNDGQNLFRDGDPDSGGGGWHAYPPHVAVAILTGLSELAPARIDVLDPAHAPGTGTPEPGGLTTRELQMILRGLTDLNLVGGDVVEVAPAYDHAELTTIAAANVVYELLGLMALRTTAATRSGTLDDGSPT